ncbi:MAG: hypothetical protein HY680_05365 [Chloroflexi bacterium]|nr:hypothetical protein [Chloroflexota bacterium]
MHRPQDTPQPSPNPSDTSSLMAAVAAIVDAVLAKQGIVLSPQKQSRWKAVQRREAEIGLLWRQARGYRV